MNSTPILDFASRVAARADTMDYEEVTNLASQLAYQLQCEVGMITAELRNGPKKGVKKLIQQRKDMREQCERATVLLMKIDALFGL